MKPLKVTPANRFQSAHFKQRLGLARSYQRQTPWLPDSVLGKVGKWLWSIPKKISIPVVLLLLLALWLTVLPNPLKVKGISADSVPQHLRSSATAVAQRFLDSHWFQKRSLLLTRTSALARSIETSEPRLTNVRIHRVFPGSLSLEATERPAYFSFTTPLGPYAAAADGTILGPVGILGSTSSTSSLVELPAENIVPTIGTTVSAGPKLDAAVRAATLLLSEGGAAVRAVSFPSTGEIYFETKRGYQVRLDDRTDLQLAAHSLSTLLLNLRPEEIDQAAYIDLRVPARAYVCQKGQPCEQPLATPVTPASTTPTTQTTP